jgi:hypothetical protein
MFPELWFPEQEPEDDILRVEQCPLCDHYIVDGYVPQHGGASCCRFVVRFDLGGQAICEQCDQELGPDQARIKVMSLSPDGDRMIAEYLTKR